MITKNYIKMCEKAEEIQKAWKPENGDRFIYKNDLGQEIVLYRKESGEPAFDIMRGIMFYLPTQEQLQEMIKKETYRLRIEKFEENILIECFFKNKVEGSYYVTGRLKLEGNNYQELLLRIVMYRKYSKVWNGEKWAKAE